MSLLRRTVRLQKQTDKVNYDRESHASDAANGPSSSKKMALHLDTSKPKALKPEPLRVPFKGSLRGSAKRYRILLGFLKGFSTRSLRLLQGAFQGSYGFDRES